VLWTRQAVRYSRTTGKVEKGENNVAQQATIIAALQARLTDALK